jgi:outer membrane protein OmpA-like peptidoglycan-associated protein
MSVNYSASVPFQQWMEGATLILESYSWGCCSSEAYQDNPMANNILINVPCEQIPASVPVPAQTTGDVLASTFSFVIPESQWNEAEPIYDEDRDKALIVYYRLGKNDIQLDFENNRMTINNMLAAVNTILESPDSRISRIVVAGFSSPEGPFLQNDKLAWERAITIKEYIMKNTRMQECLIHVYNGSEDWRGLRAMVASSNLHDKAEILRIIDTVPILSADGRRKERLEQLQRLNGGGSYRYMQRYFFPMLRNGAFIRVYYNNR